MNPVITEVVEYLYSWDIEPTKENIKRILNRWIKNLYSHIGIESHQHSLSCGITDQTGLTWEEQDMQTLQQIETYKKCIEELEYMEI